MLARSAKFVCWLVASTAIIRASNISARIKCLFYVICFPATVSLSKSDTNFL